MALVTSEVLAQIQELGMGRRQPIPSHADPDQYNRLALLGRLFEPDEFYRHSQGQGLPFFFMAISGAVGDDVELFRQQQMAEDLLTRLAGDEEWVSRVTFLGEVKPEPSVEYGEVLALTVIETLVYLAGREIREILPQLE